MLLRPPKIILERLCCSSVDHKNSEFLHPASSAPRSPSPTSVPHLCAKHNRVVTSCLKLVGFTCLSTLYIQTTLEPYADVVPLSHTLCRRCVFITCYLVRLARCCTELDNPDSSSCNYTYVVPGEPWRLPRRRLYTAQVRHEGRAL